LLVSAIILFILVLVSGVLASSEIAISSSNRNVLKIQAEKGDKKAARLLATIEDPNVFFATTQLYYTFIAFFSGAYAASSFTEPLVNFAISAGLPISTNIAEPVAFMFVTAVLTYVTLILGELVPKRLAMRYATPYALKILPFLNVLSLIAMPVVKLLSVSSKLVLHAIGFKDDVVESDITKEELRMIVESSSESGLIDENEHDMIENIFKINQLTAEDICTHRLDIVALSAESDFQTVLDMLSGHYFSRVPVYKDSIDHICGILYTKDVLRYVAITSDVSGFNIMDLKREPYFVPSSKKLDELFAEMRSQRVYMAVVIDEYGGTMGIITMEDLVEKIVGSIHDEYDIDEPPEVLPVSEGVYRIQGTAHLEAVQNQLEVPLPIDDYDTLSGFLIGQLGRIPSEDEQPEIVFANLVFKIESVQDKRVTAVMVTKSTVEINADNQKTTVTDA